MDTCLKYLFLASYVSHHHEAGLETHAPVSIDLPELLLSFFPLENPWHGLWSQTTWVLSIACHFIGCVALGMLPNLSEPTFFLWQPPFHTMEIWGGLKCNLPAPQYRGGTLDVCLLNGTHCRVLSVFSLYAKGDLTIVLLWSWEEQVLLSV